MFNCCCHDTSGTAKTVETVPTIEEHNSKAVAKVMQAVKAQHEAECNDIKAQCEPIPDTEPEGVIAKALAPAPEQETCEQPANAGITGCSQPANAGIIADFTVYLRRNAPQEPLGIAVTMEDQGTELVIKALQGKPASEWNARFPDLRLRPGDQFISVNTIAGPAQDLLNELQSRAHTFQMVMRRTLLVTATGVKKGTFGFGLCAESMEVQEIFPGFLAAHNEAAPPSKQVYSGDKLIEVGGLTGNTAVLLAALQSCKDGDDVTLRFSRARPLFSPETK